MGCKASKAVAGPGLVDEADPGTFKGPSPVPSSASLSQKGSGMGMFVTQKTSSLSNGQQNNGTSSAILSNVTSKASSLGQTGSGAGASSMASSKGSKGASPRSRTSPTSQNSSSTNNNHKEIPADHVYQILWTAYTHPDRLRSEGLSIPRPYMTSLTAAYQHPETKATPLHVAMRLLDVPNVNHPQKKSLVDVIHTLLEVHPTAIYAQDADGNMPLHYAIAPTSLTDGSVSDDEEEDENEEDKHLVLVASDWSARTVVVKMLLEADLTDASTDYLQINNIEFSGFMGGCSALYRALQTIPDEFEMMGHTVAFIQTVVAASGSAMVSVGNASDGDKPLALLYRRFTRQFDLAEKFFSGDNSRPEVVEHRRRYKTAASNTWKIIETLLRASQDEDEHTTKAQGGDDDDDRMEFRTVHRAVQVETPPDLLRYIVETNAEDLATDDEYGRLPLHYAAMNKPPTNTDYHVSFPAFYSKYVIDELLYKYPEAASKQDADGNYPLTLAVRAGKQWIGGGIKSLHEAFPDALQQINLEEHRTLKAALSIDQESTQSGAVGDSLMMDKEEKSPSASDCIIRDEHHDAIMLVQQPDVDISEVVTSLWAHEEDPGVQMLGCVAVARLVDKCNGPDDILSIALSAVPAVVNAMKAHPNEVIVQEKACLALKGMASSDGKREVSFVASGAVAAIVGAMQAHVSDPGVQEEGCGAIARIIHHGGDDRATIVASVSGLTAIVNALAAHPHVEGVQRDACEALRELTEFQQNANIPELPQSQVEPLLDAARAEFPEACRETVEILLSRLSA